jgi:hypothetical protein
MFRGTSLVFHGKGIDVPRKDDDVPWKTVDVPWKDDDVPRKIVDVPGRMTRRGGAIMTPPSTLAALPVPLPFFSSRRRHMPMRKFIFTVMVILRVCYMPVEGTDVEHGQGAIERNELAHHPLTDTTWLIRVEEPADPRAWEKRLNASVDAKHGAFSVEPASAEERARADRGEIRFQQ